MPKSSILVSLGLIVAFVFVLSSCTKTETKSNKPAPTIELSQAAASNVAGSQVSTTVTVDSPEGGASLIVTVNGVADAAFTGGTLDGTTSQQITYNYSIPSGAAVGTVYTVNFQASDKKSQNSQSATFTVTVSAVPAKQKVDVGTDGQSTYITSNTTWTADKIWVIHGFVRVGKDLARTGTGLEVTGVTLTIEPGTVVYGAPGTPGGTLIIQRGNKINAAGTAAKPIVFTSAKDPNARKAGDWGGIVICGKATNNITSAATDGGGASLELSPGLGELEGGYGGFHGGTSGTTDENDNSGVITYVRSEYAGYPIQPNQELNEFTFGSVGAGTTFSYVQASYSNDDSFEWFGGSMKCDHIIAYKGLDDDFDTDNGFHGQVQFGLGIRDLNIADQSGSNAFESDNDANGSYNGNPANGDYQSSMPYTTAVFSNMTIIGGKKAFNTPINIQFQNTAQIRRSSKLQIINSFFTGYPNGIFWDSGKGNTVASINDGGAADGSNKASVVKNNVIAGVYNWGGNGFGSVADHAEISNVTGLPFQVPITTGSSTLGNAAHPIVPIGHWASAGPNAFASNKFAMAGDSIYLRTNVADATSAVHPLKYFTTFNKVVARWDDSTLGIDGSIFDPLAAGTPKLTLGAGSILLSGADFAGYGTLSSVSYKGAFDGSNDWTTGWVNWNPLSSDYSK